MTLQYRAERFGFEKVARVESLQEIIDDMAQENAR